MDQIPHVNVKKYSRNIIKAKKAARTELSDSDWTRFDYKSKDFWIHKNQDFVTRIDYDKVEIDEFIEKYQSRNIPVVIQGCTRNWKAQENWNISQLAYKYRHEKFKVGEDDDGNVVYMGFKYYLHYALKGQGRYDDSPLYIFDSGFGKRTLHHSYRRKEIKPSTHKYDPNSSQATCHLVDDYAVPKYFQDDLFSLVGNQRPPFRWFVCGPARSGTGIHVDPLGTSAWNSLIRGHKRWVLFPPHTPKSIIAPKLKDHEAVTWFVNVYPEMLKPSKKDSLKTLGQELGMIDILQMPGETVFVPGGWWHLVLNLDFSIAITQVNIIN
jgi:histone arginine demethylase JMJD6